jgi:hypothetical protein
MPSQLIPYTPMVMPSVINGPAPVPTPVGTPTLPYSVTVPIPMQFHQPLPGTMPGGYSGGYGAPAYPMPGMPMTGVQGLPGPYGSPIAPNSVAANQDGLLGLLMVVAFVSWAIGAWMGYKFK